jgi:hypothetical protein
MEKLCLYCHGKFDMEHGQWLCDKCAEEDQPEPKTIETLDRAYDPLPPLDQDYNS